MAVSDFRKRLDEDLKKQGKKQGESNPRNTDEYDLANRFSTAKKTIAPSVSQDLYSSAHYLSDKFQNNAYKIGGSQDVNRAGITGAAKGVSGEAAYYKNLYKMNPGFFKQYFGDEIDWDEYFADVSDETIKLSDDVFNMAAARTGGLDAIDMSGMPKAQQQELRNMGNLSQTDDVYAALSQTAAETQKPNIGKMFDDPNQYAQFVASGASMPGAEQKNLFGETVTNDDQLSVLLGERKTYDDYLKMYSAYPSEALRKDLMNIQSYNTERNVYAVTPEQYEASRARVYAATGTDYDSIARESGGADNKWMLDALGNYEAGEKYLAENVFGEVSEEDWYRYHDAYMDYMESSSRQGNKLDTWEEEADRQTNAQLNASDGIDYYRPAPMYLNIDPTYLEGHREYQNEDGTYMPAEEYRENAINEWLMAYVDAGNDEAKIKALDEARGEYLPELEEYNLDKLRYLEPDQQKAIFTAFNNGDVETVKNLIQTYDPILNYQRSRDVIKAWEQKYNEASTAEKIGMNVQSVGQNVGTALEGVKQAVWSIVAPDELKKITEYDPVYDKTRKANKTRELTGGEFAQATDGVNIPFADRNLVEAIYHGVMSGVDSFVIANLLAPLGPAAQAIAMGGISFANERMGKLEAGYSESDANMDAWIQSFIEGVTEYIPFDIMSKNSPHAWRKALGGIYAGSVGEGVSELGGALYDEIKYGDYRDQLLVEGNRGSEASLWLKWLEHVGPDVASATISGLFGESPMQIVSASSENRQNKTFGENIRDNDSFEYLTDLAESVEISDTAKGIVERMRGEIADKKKGDNAVSDKAGVTKAEADAAVKEIEQTARDKGKRGKEGKRSKSVSNAEIGYVYREVMKSLDSASQNVVAEAFSRDVLETELAKAGFRGDMRKAANTVEKFINGKGNKNTYEALRSNQAMRKVALDFVGEIEFKEAAYRGMARELAYRASKDYVKPESTKAEKGAQEGTQGVDDRAAISAEDIEVSDVPESTVDGKAVTIEGVASVAEDGSVTFSVKDADGNVSEVSEADVAYGQNDAGIAAVAQNAKELGANADSMLKAYNSEQNAAEYSAAFKQAVQYGDDGRNLDAIKNDSALSTLTEQQIEIAYNIGRGVRTGRNDAMVRKNASGVKVGQVDTSAINMRALKANQAATVRSMTNIAKAIGFNVKFVESKANAEGRYTTENGRWDPKTLTLTLDVHAGSNSTTDTNYAMIHTAGHELTHYIKQFADGEMWNAYQEFVVGHLSKKDGAEFNLENEITSRMNAEGLARDAAIVEVIADASGEALNMISEADIQSLAETNPGLMSKIKQFFKQWIGNLKKMISTAYKGTEAKNEVARQMMDAVDEMGKRWNALLVNAAKNRAENVVSETTNAKEDAASTETETVLPYTHIDQRTFDSVAEKETELFCSEVEEAQIGMAAAANILLADLENSIPGQKVWMPDNEVTGQKRQTSALLGRMKDDLNLTWDGLRQRLQQFAGMENQEQLPKNTVNNRRIELYLNEMLTEGYTTLDGTKINAWPEYIDAVQSLEGADVQKKYSPVNGAVDFVDYAYAGEMKYSIRRFADGEKYVHVDTEQEQFEGLSGNELRKKAQDYLIKNYRGKVAGSVVRAYMTGVSERKLLYPNKTHNMRIIEAISKAVPELGNLLDSSTLISEEADSATHSHGAKVVGWRKYKTVFEVNGMFVEGITNIQITKHGDVYYGMSKLKDITNSPTVQSNLSEEDRTAGNASDKSIAQGDGDVKFSARKTDPDDVHYSELYDDYQTAQKELREIEDAYKTAVNNEELRDAMMALIEFEGSRFSPERKKLEQNLKNIQEKLGIEGINERKNQAKGRVEAAKKAMDDFETEVALKRERQAIEKSGLTEAEYFAKQAVKEFGYTPSFTDAGYMLQSGKLLNFSGEKNKHFGIRGQDHRAIGIIYERTSGTKALTRFLNDGNIRVISEAPGLDIASAKEPTAQQYAQIRKFAAEYADKRFMNIDFSDENGRNVGKLAYDGKIVPDKVVNDIKHFYQTGEIREQSDLSRFLYQKRDLSNLTDRDLLVSALETDLSEAERSHLSKYKEKVEQLNKDQRKLEELNTKIVELRNAGFTPRTSEELRAAETNVVTLRRRIDREDAKLKEIESAAMIKEVIKRNRAAARKKAYSLARQRADERQARAVEKAREVGQKKIDRLRESQAKEKYKKRIMDDANALMKWISSPVAGSSVPKFLAVPISDFIDAIDFSGRNALKARDILESGDDAKIAEWLGEAIKRRDKAKQTYEFAKAQYEAIKEAYSEEEIDGDKKGRNIAEEEIKEAQKRMNIAKGRYEMEARAVENGIESSASAYTNRDMTITKALENMRKAISNYSKEYHDLNEGKKAEYKFLDLPEAFTETIDELVTSIEDSFAKYAERDLYTDALADTPLNRMNAEQLKRLSEIITTIRTSVRQINTNLANARYESNKDMSNHTIDDMNELTERKKVNKAVEAVNSLYNWKNSTPIMAFQKLGRGGKAVFEALQNGWDKMARNSSEVIKYAEDTFNAKESNAWSKEVSDIELDSGETIQMTVAQKMSLYCLSKREQAMGHLLGGGIRISDIDGKRGTKITQTGNYVLTQEDIDNIIDSLTDRQKEVADKLQRFMNTVCAEWGNEISMKRFGYEQMTEDNYFPIESDKNNLKKIDETQDGRTSMFRLLNMSSLKPLTANANNAIVIHDIFDVFADHASNMAKYNAMALPILDFIKWYNYSEKIPVTDASGKPTGQHETKSVRQALERAYGKDADSYLLNFIKDINAEHDGGRNDGIINKFMNLAKAASVGANLRVYALQITSLPRAAFVINKKYLAKGVVAHKERGAAQENVGILQWKALGFFSTDIARNTRTMIKQDENWLAKVRGWQMKPAELMDNVTANIIYEAVKAEMADLHKDVKPGSDQYKRMVNNRVREIIYKTQVADSTMTRSELMRSKGAWPMFTAFMSESTISVNMLNEGIQEAIYKKRGGTLDENDIKPGTKIYKATMCFIANGMFGAMVAAAFGAFRDDDEYETFKDKYLSALKDSAIDNLNILGMLPLINEASDALGAALKGKDYSMDSMAGQALSSLVDTVNAAREYGEGKRTFVNMMYNALKALSYGIGLGIYNATRDAISIYNTFFAPAFGTKKLQNYKTSEKKTAAAMYEAARNGDAALFDEYVSRSAMYGIEAEDLEGEYNKLISDDYLAGDIGEDDALSMLKMYGGKTTYQAQTVLYKLDYQKESGEKFSDVEKNYVSGKISKADAKAALTKYGDTTASDADDKILTWDYEKTTGRKYSSLDNAYIRGEVTHAEIKSAKIKYGGKDSNSAESTILHLDYQKKTGRPWSKLMDDYHAGRFNSTQLKKYFMNYDGKSENEALDLVDKYDWAKTHGGSTDGYSKYITIHEAIDSGRGFDEAVQKIVDKYTARGETRKEVLSNIRSSITSKYKPIYLAASASEQARMREYLLEVYVALGGNYNTYYKNMTDKWFED